MKHIRCTIFTPLIYFSFHAFIALVIGTAALFQFLVIRYGKKVSSKWVYIALLFLVITSISVSCVSFYGGNSTTIRGSNCRFVNNADGAVTVGLWVVLAHTVPLAMTIVFSVLTCYKVKHDIIQSSDDEKSLVTSIVQINTFNIWVSFRENEPSLYIYKSYKNHSRLNRYNFRTVHAINILFSTLHTTPFLYGRTCFGVLHLLLASIATFDTPPGSNPL